MKGRIRKFAAVLAAGMAAAAIPFGGTADATHLCGARAIVVPIPGSEIYVQDRDDGDTVPIGLVGGEGTWIYLESNSKGGLQNWGAWPGPLADVNSDICSGSGAPDTLIL